MCWISCQISQCQIWNRIRQCWIWCWIHQCSETFLLKSENNWRAQEVSTTDVFNTDLSGTAISSYHICHQCIQLPGETFATKYVLFKFYYLSKVSDFFRNTTLQKYIFKNTCTFCSEHRNCNLTETSQNYSLGKEILFNGNIEVIFVCVLIFCKLLTTKSKNTKKENCHFREKKRV